MIRRILWAIFALGLCAGSAWAGSAPPPPSAPYVARGGVVARTPADRAAEVINILDKGAKCDGSTDDATAINLALSDARAAYGTVLFPPSATACMVGASLSVPSNVTLWATPGTVTLKMTAGSTANPGLFNIANVNNVLVYGLTLDGNLAGVPAGNNVNTVFKTSNVVFDHVTVQHTRGIGILFSQNINVSGVTNSKLNDVGNYWLTSGLNGDQQQGIAFCCGTSLTTSATQGGTSSTLTFTATTGVVDGMLVSSALIPIGSYVVSHTSTTVVLNAATTGAMGSGTSVKFTSNSNNFVTNSTFTSIGLDAVSAADQQGFTASGNTCTSAGGQNSNGGACLYISNGSGLKVVNNVANLSLGNGIDLLSQTAFLVEGNTAYKSSSRGIAVDTSTNGAIRGNHAISNQQYTILNGQGGINLSGTTTNVAIEGNISYDDQPVKTQPYGIGVNNGSAVSNIYIGPGNILTGNLSGEVGGGFGAEGVGSVDLQRNKTTQNHGATGQQATISGGVNNVASGAWSVVCGGEWNTADGEGSHACGEFSQARFRRIELYASGQLANNGDAQSGRSVMRTLTTTTTPSILGVAGGGVSQANNTCVNLPNIGGNASTIAVYGMDIDVVAVDTTTGGNLNHYHDSNATLYKTGGVATTVFTAGASPLNQTVGTAGTIAITADTTNACISVTWTAPNTHTWHVVARVLTTEAF